MSLDATIQSLTPEQRLEFGKRLATELVAYVQAKRTAAQEQEDQAKEQARKKQQSADHLAQLRTALDSLYE